jgi:MFS transporter, Spinster family, sphingosine-1-phosphate transporter
LQNSRQQFDPAETSGGGGSLARTAWLVVALLWPVALLNYLDRQMLATMKTSMVTDIAGLTSDAQWGFVLGSFKWVYAALSPIGGYLADRFSRKRIIVISLFTWSAVTWMTGHVATYEQLVWTRALMGISEAFYIPTALALIADFHRGNTRSRAVGSHQTGIYIGLILGGYAGYVADAPDFGWRWAFSIAGLVGVVYSVPLLFFLRNPERPADVARESVSPVRAAGELFGNRNFLLLVLYFMLPAIAGWVIKDWMPVILKNQFHLSQGRAGVIAVLYVQLATIVGALAGGWLADRWMRRTQRGRIYVSAIGMILFLPALFGLGNPGTIFLAAMFLVLFGLGWGFFDCNNMPILCQVTRPELRATGYGFMNLISISCGGLGDWGFGALRDRGVSLTLIFGCFTGVALLSLLVVLLIRPGENAKPSH